MNQENNNLNSNQFNTQGNNGVTNNQPLYNTFGQTTEQNVNINQSIFNPQPQLVSGFKQPIMQETIQQPMNTSENVNNNNQSFNNKPPKKRNLELIIVIVGVIVIISIGIILGGKLLSNDKKIDNKKPANEPDAEVKHKNTDGKYIIYLNDMKITLGETTIDYIVENTNLEIVSDSTEYIYCGLGDCEGDQRKIELSDGKNIIFISSYIGFPNKPKDLITFGGIDDGNQFSVGPFDLSTGTKITFVDNALGKNVNMGDTITYEDFENVYKSPKNCSHIIEMLKCSQTNRGSIDNFTYWLDQDFKIISMDARLDR